MTAMARPLPKKSTQESLLSEETRKVLKRRFRIVLVVDTLCFFLAFVGVVAHVNLHQFWGMPLFALAMIAGFGAQIAFIIGLVKASRAEKGA